LQGKDAGQYEIIGEKCSYRLAQRPGSYVVLKYIRQVTKQKDTGKVACPLMPGSIFERSLADVSFLAGMLVDKFNYHQPLYRQHQRLKDNGIELSRSTLTNLTRRAIDLLKPVCQAQLKSILSGDHIGMDETPIKAGRKSKGKLNKAWFWPIYGQEDEIVFSYSLTRAASHVRETLADFSGTLQTDGYAAYTSYAKSRDDINHALCWSHTRRMFVKAQLMEPDLIEQVLDIIGKLYRIEKEIRDQQLIHTDKLEYRVLHSKPVIETFFAWCDKNTRRNDLLPSNPLAKALGYALDRKAGLSLFLQDPEVSLDTNHLERGLRPIPMGRKNWLFCWTELGAEHVAIIQSLLVACRMHQVNPYTYLVDVLQRVGQHPAADVHELTPRIWKNKFAQNFLTSDLDRLG